jgi:hypothetical protein
MSGGQEQPAASRLTAVKFEGTPWSTAVCWNCGTESPGGTDTECPAPDCRRPLVPPALLVVFPDGQVEVQPGDRAALGRHGPHSRLFEAYPNVSRRHVVLGVDADGRAWIEPLRTSNGTFVNGDEVSPVQRTLDDDDTVRLAGDVEGTVTIFAGRRRDP